MFLSGKGFQEVRKICWESSHNCLKIAENLNQFDFKQEHFKDCVVLTVEEAKAVLECVDACAFPSPFEGFVSENILLRDKLKKRIKQAEIEHLKHENTQLKKDQARDNLEIERLEESYKNLKYSVLEQVEDNND